MTAQSIASAASTMPNIIFVLPALILVGHWARFSFAETTLLAVGGGILGTLAAIVLSRVTSQDATLPFPEAVAVAEILQVRPPASASTDAPAEGLRILLSAAAGSACLVVLQSLKWVAAGAAIGAQAASGAVWSIGAGFSLALVGAGYLAGLSTGIALLLGYSLVWLIGVPVLTLGATGAVDPLVLARHAWSEHARLLGAGTMMVGAICSIITFATPLARALSHRASGKSDLAVQWRGGAAFGIPAFAGVAALSLATMIFGQGLPSIGGVLLATAVVGAVTLGLLLAPPSGTIAGMVGTSSSPISAVGLIAVVVIAATLVFARPASGATAQDTIPLTLFLGSAVMVMASMTNGGAETMKTADLMGVRQGPQAIALMLGVVLCALVTGPALQLLATTYGFVGGPGHPVANGTDALAAPQAEIMTLLARGIIGGSVDWGILGSGAAIGALVFAVDRGLPHLRPGLRLPVFGVGFGMYLPAEATSALVVGSLLAFIVQRMLARTGRANPPLVAASVHRRGILIASGLIAGESLASMALAISISLDRHLGPHVSAAGSPRPVLGAALFIVCCGLILRGIIAQPERLPGRPMLRVPS